MNHIYTQKYSPNDYSLLVELNQCLSRPLLSDLTRTIFEYTVILENRCRDWVEIRTGSESSPSVQQCSGSAIFRSEYCMEHLGCQYKLTRGTRIGKLCSMSRQTNSRYCSACQYKNVPKITINQPTIV